MKTKIKTPKPLRAGSLVRVTVTGVFDRAIGSYVGTLHGWTGSGRAVVKVDGERKCRIEQTRHVCAYSV